jgi:hypothetical protein
MGYNPAMGEPPFAPAMTGPIDDPRHLRPDVAAELFDEQTRERLERLAGALRFSAADLIREGTMRYMDELEHPQVDIVDSADEDKSHLR